MDRHFEPTGQQVAALKVIKDWWEERRQNQQVFYLAGYAGTGKTSLARVAVEQLGLDPDEDVTYGAYTGKAALVLRQKGLPGATTIHRLIYRAITLPSGGVRFELNQSSIVSTAKLVILDECSMIDNKMAMDLLSFGTPIIVLGDPAQLPPINGAGIFTSFEPDVFLTEIHRQAAGNPILQLAHKARIGEPIPFGTFGPRVRRIPANSRDFSLNDMVQHDQVLTGKNNTRKALNRIIKDHFGHDGTYPIKPGAKVICLRNQHSLGVLNGMIFTTLDDCKPPRNKKYFNQTLFDDENMFEELPIYTGHFDAYIREVKDSEHQKHLGKAWRSGEPLSECDWGYAITVHKSQGSGWNSIVIYDDGFARWDHHLRQRWLYTAITRAEDQLTIITE